MRSGQGREPELLKARGPPGEGGRVGVELVVKSGARELGTAACTSGES